MIEGKEAGKGQNKPWGTGGGEASPPTYTTHKTSGVTPPAAPHTPAWPGYQEYHAAGAPAGQHGETDGSSAGSRED